MGLKKDKYNSTRWRDNFLPPLSEDGVTVETSAGEQDPNETVHVYWPVTGTIVNVHYCNSPKNRSLIDRIGASQNYFDSVVKEVVTGEETVEVVDPTDDFQLESGFRFECDVIIDSGFGVAERDLIRPNVPVCNAFGGFKNYGFVTPHTTTNSSFTGSDSRYDGDKVIVQFIGGDIDRPLITGFLPHPFNVEDGPKTFPGEAESGAFFRVSGVELAISDNGDTTLDLSDANSLRLLNAQTGKTTVVQPNRKEVAADDDENQPPGAFQVISKSNQVYSASYLDEDVNVGDILFQAKTHLTAKSEVDDIDIYTDDSTKDVKLQAPHGGLRNAARIYDKVKITSGNDNDLFSWCARVANVLNQVGDRVASAGASLGDTDLIFAGNMLQGLSTGLPTYSEGRIIEGSPYVQIAGAKTSQDNPDQEVIDTCTKDTSSSFATDVSGSTCKINDISTYFATLDTISGIISFLEIPSEEVAGELVPLPPVFPWQVLPIGSSDKIDNIKVCLVKWLATCPDTTWPPKFQEIIDPLIALGTSIDAWTNLATDLDALFAIIDTAKTLISGTVCDFFDISTESDILSTAISDGSINTKTNGAFSQAVDDCVDTQLSES